LELVAATGLDAEARILDVGGGSSTFVDHLLDLGFHNVDVLDISEPAIRHAQTRLGWRASRVRWQVRDVTTFTTGHRFDLWHDRAVLHFLTRKHDRERYAYALGAAVKPRGHVIISTFSLDGPMKCSGLRVRRYGPDEISALLGPRFDLVDTRRETHLTPSGEVRQRFSYFRLRGRGDGGNGD
jgi:2-polyprenyl-3-methyl-5-hydroxy-6-metoxy-1,4-benzoquinol methylase